jgi:hypothetical protein
MTWRRARWIVLAAALAVGAVACARILGFAPRGRKAFEHREHVLAGVSCVTCHAGIASAGEDGPLHLPDDASCVTCHEAPHDRRSCLGCHGEAYTAADTLEARAHLRFSHASHEDPLRGNCMRCHTAVAEGGKRLRPAMSTCLGCHEHEQEFADRTCGRCHVDLEVEASMPASHLVHEPGWDRSHGTAATSAADLCATCHGERFCAGCHGATTPALAATRFFDDPTHPSAHRAGFFARHGDQARAEPASCTTCHAQERCLGCHQEQQVAPLGGATGLVGSPHPPGWVGAGAGANEHGREARRDPVSCASCHSGPGEALCVSCHVVGGIGGTPHPPGWSSTLDRLRDTPCRACHAP